MCLAHLSSPFFPVADACFTVVQLEDRGLRPPSCRWVHLWQLQQGHFWGVSFRQTDLVPKLAQPPGEQSVPPASQHRKKSSALRQPQAVWKRLRYSGAESKRYTIYIYIYIYMNVPWRPSEFELCSTPLPCPAGSGCLSLPECPALSSSQGGSEVLCGALSAPDYRKAVNQGTCFTGAGRWARESWLQGRI